MEALAKFCEEKNIKSGSIAGLGGTDNAWIKYYDLKKKKYISKKFSGKNYEIISLNGNISGLNRKPFLHVHAALGDSNFKVFGGHLGSAVIAITGEIIINVTDSVIKRKLDDEFKLNFLDL